MKVFHISDVLSVTTGRLVSARHMDGLYDILNFLTGHRLFTHQLPRAGKECEPWMAAQFPRLMEDDPTMTGLLGSLDSSLQLIKSGGYRAPQDRFTAQFPDDPSAACVARWVDTVRIAIGYPEHIPVYEMGADMHVRIDPLEEARAMAGDQCIISIVLSEP